MTAYPPQQPVRKLTRSRSNKMLGGVCAGVANYLNMDVTLVRILTVVLSLFTGIPIVAYIVMLLVVPEEDVPPYVGPQTVHVPESATAGAPTTPPAAPPTTPPTDQPADPVWGAEGAPWEQTSTTSAGASDQSAGTPTAEPGPAPADPGLPNEAAPVADPEPLPEDGPAQPAAEETSTWESTPADPKSSEGTSDGGTSEGDKPSS